MSRRRAPRPLASALEGFVAGIAPATVLAEVLRVWPAAVGPVIAEQSEPTAEREGTLTVTCAAAVWAQELDLMGPEIVERVNAALGRDAIRALRCQAAPSRAWARADS